MSAQALGERLSQAISAIHKTKKTSSAFKVGDTVKVHARIVEGNKERIQIFEGVVISRKKGTSPSATFTVRKISYNVGVERTFLLHSPRVEKIEVVSRGSVRRAKLFYLRDTVGKAGRIKTKLYSEEEASSGIQDSSEETAKIAPTDSEKNGADKDESAAEQPTAG